jgi:hypothetical protein
MNRTVYELLKGYLFRSVWLYAFLGLAQFGLTGVYWLRGWGRMPIAGAALGIWGANAALNAKSLVWRSLPLNSRDASVFRWWAMAGAPGLYLTLLTGLLWASHRSSGFPTPAPNIVFEGIFANWAVLGVAAVLFRAPAFYVVRALSAKAIAMVTCALMLLCYGVPVGLANRPYSIAFIAVGMVLLVISAARAYRDRHWRWPDVASRTSPPARRSRPTPSVPRYGIWTVLVPLLRRTAIHALIAIALVAALHFIFPRAGAALFWVYFICISTAGSLLTHQFRSALQVLRCLPLSTRQLAGLLQILGALPGVAALGLAFFINRTLLGIDISMNISAVATFALIVIALQTLPFLGQQYARVRGVPFGRWFPLAQRIFSSAYIGVMGATYGGALASLSWFRWGLVAAGAGLCLSGYFILVYQLRAGMRPSSNEKLFSAV